MHDELHLSCKFEIFGLEWPTSVIITMGEDLVQLNPGAADEVVGGEGVAVPHSHADLTEPLDEGYLKLLLERGVLAAICAGASAELGIGVLKADVRILAGEQLGVPQFGAPNHGDLKDLALDSRDGRH